ncbi:DUF6220 domain-containing protein [Paractinoplanes brasiliensis]|uniref:Uncharacterized protein n=1 Tax=Paractinoplanes brasiliensis TaxID=52695 RepID=A0A4R6JA25_9ACTN|nr:DUF6220 domain-containing protein [Actinoplanes brasiliensis]TDO32510.1 hypothetical protein C8E87_7974 [Actinoplanes brasiliensis]GID27615.1 hypothetical protein Abr02nite_25980 [Actinoplanes brasiliensis]
MRKAFVISSTALLFVFAFQFVFAAVGAFTRPQSDSSYALHSLTGMAIIPALTVLTTVFALLARAPGRLIGLTVLPLGLTILQALLAVLADAFAGASGGSTTISLVVGGLHAVNGIVAVHFVVAAVRGARELDRPRASVPADSVEVA